MKNNVYIFISSYFLVACLPFESIKTNIIYQNQCEYKIEIYDPMSIPERFSLDKGGKQFHITHAEYDIIRKSLPETSYQANNKESKFYIENPDKYTYMLIACPENAKPIGDGNWIKAN